MSTRIETYVIVGVLLDVDAIFKSRDNGNPIFEFQDFPWCGKGATGTMGILLDGMSGDYGIAGHCLGVSDEEGQSFGLLALDDVSPKTVEAVNEWLEESGLNPYVKEPKVRNYVVHHWH